MTDPVKFLRLCVYVAIETIIDFWTFIYMERFYNAEEIMAAIDELDHFTLGKIDYYKHTDYERDLLFAVVMKR